MRTREYAQPGQQKHDKAVFLSCRAGCFRTPARRKARQARKPPEQRPGKGIWFLGFSLFTSPFVMDWRRRAITPAPLFAAKIRFWDLCRYLITLHNVVFADNWRVFRGNFQIADVCPAFSGASPRIYPVTDSPVGFCTVINVCAPLPPLEIWSLVTVRNPFAAGGVCWGNRLCAGFVCFGGAVWGAGAVLGCTAGAACCFPAAGLPADRNCRTNWLYCFINMGS